MADNQSVWNFEVDSSGAIKNIQTVAKEMVPIQKAATSLAKQGGVLGAAVGDTKKGDAAVKILAQLNVELIQEKKALADIERQLKSETDLTHFRKLTDEAEKYRRKIDDLKDEMRGLSPKGGKNAGGFSGISYGMSTQSQISNVLSSFSMMDSQLGKMSREILGVTDAGARMQDTFSMLGQSAIDSGGKLNSKLGGALVKLAPALGYAGAAIAGVTLATVAWQSVIDRGNATLYERLRREEALLDVQRQIKELMATGQEGDAKRAAQDIQNQIDIVEKKRDDAVTKAAAMGDVVGAYATVFFQMLDDIFYPGQHIRPIGGAADEIRDFNTQISDLYDQLKAIEDNQGAIDAAARVRDAEQQLTDVRKGAADAYYQNSKQILDFWDNLSFTEMMTNRERGHQTMLDERAHNKEMETITRDGGKAREGIVKDYNKTITGIYKDEMKSAAQALKQLQRSFAAQDKSYQKSVTGAWDAYYKNRAKEEKRWQKEQAKQDEQWAREELRRAQDLKDNLVDLEFQNDAVAYIQAQRAAAKENARTAEDRALELSDRSTERQEAMDEEREALQEQLDDLRISRDEARQELIDSYHEEAADRQEALKERIAEEKASLLEQLQANAVANAEQLAQAQAAYEEQQALQLEAQQWEDETTRINNQRQLEQIKQSFNDQMTEAERHERELLGVIESGGTKAIETVTYKQLGLVSAYKDGANAAIAAVRSAFASASFSSYGGGSNYAYNEGMDVGGSGNSISGLKLRPGGGTGGYGMFADKGGVFNKPTLTLIAERRPEMVIPLRPSGGLPSDVLSKLGGGGYHFDFSGMQVGGGVTPDLLQSQLRLMGQTVVQAIHDARAGAPA